MHDSEMSILGWDWQQQAPELFDRLGCVADVQCYIDHPSDRSSISQGPAPQQYS
jgi:hypothetical protein